MSEKVKHIVGFSGGIDSQACARWVLNRYPKEDVILTNSDAGGNEHPLTTEFVDWYSQNVHPVVKCNAIVADMWQTENYAEKRGLDGNETLSFGRLAEIKGRFPSNQAQFCTDILKLRPVRRWIRGAFGPGGKYDGWGYVRYSGVRNDESRKRQVRKYKEWDAWFDCDLYNPLIDWTKKMCFEFVAAHGEPYNRLYQLGFGRVGCAPCVNSGKDDIVNWATRFPEMIDKVREWERQSGRTFFHSASISGFGNDRWAWIDDVVAWAKTSRGGRQQPFPIFHEREACESKYGLCE